MRVVQNLVGCEKKRKRKSSMCMVIQMKACVDCDIDFACHVDVYSCHELVNYVHLMTSFK